MSHQSIADEAKSDKPSETYLSVGYGLDARLAFTHFCAVYAPRMGYVIGTEGQRFVVPESGPVQYVPDGNVHAVDDSTPISEAAHLGYAICGTPVHVWQMPLEQADVQLHDACRARLEQLRR
ncbi:MAG: hypothetical protein JO147_11875 [Actinobacteria bacterium]|nr:hypothetical protein [Actinomycetota bacterium]